MSKLKISIALATFNGALYLREQLDSISSQEKLPYELVVVDDCSTDSTLEILRDFSLVAPFSVRIFLNKSRLGYGMNFLKSASLCTGEVISFCDQDDVWNSNKLSCVANAFTTNQADFVVHSALVTDSNLNSIGKNYPHLRRNFCLDPSEMMKDFFPGFAISVSKRFFKCVNNLLDQPGFHTDAHDELMCNLATTGWNRSFISENLVKYRQHSRNLIGYHGAISKLNSHININEVS